MFKAIAIVTVALVLVGCGQVDRTIAQYTGYSKMCVEGVSYLQFTSGATVQVDVNGKPVPCTK